MLEDGLKKADWLVNLRNDIEGILRSHSPIETKLDDLTHIVVKERADMMTAMEFDYGLTMPDVPGEEEC